MPKEKKNAVITFRTTEKIKTLLEEEADRRGWSVSQLAEKIIATYTENEEKNRTINFISNEITIHNIN